MTNFDYMEFGYGVGYCDCLVFHAKKYSKEKAVEIFNEEYEYKGLKVTVQDVSDGYARYFNHPPDCMADGFEDGCYCLVDKAGKGAFPVWIIELSKLQQGEGA